MHKNLFVGSLINTLIIIMYENKLFIIFYANLVGVITFEVSFIIFV